MSYVEPALRKMLAAFCLHENSWDENQPMDWRGGRYTRDMESCFAEVCDDELEARFLYLASQDSNDLQEIAEDLGFKMVFQDTRTNPPVEINYEEERKLPVDDWVPVSCRRAVVRDLTDEEKAERKRQQEEWEREIKKMQASEKEGAIT